MTGLTLSAFVIGLVGSIFAFWGWDTCLTLGEESKDPTKVPVGPDCSACSRSC